MAFHGRALKKRLAIVLGLSMGGAMLAILSGVYLSTKQAQLEPIQNITIVSNDAGRSAASEHLDSLLDEEPRPWLLAQSLPLRGPSGHIGERFALGIDTVLRELK